jgi:hypothetical protein
MVLNFLYLLCMKIPFKISETLSHVFIKKTDDDGDFLTLNEIMMLLHDKGFGLIILVFSLLNLIPLVATLVALPQIIFCMQMMLRYDAPKLPNFIGKKSVKRETLQSSINQSLRLIKKVEKITRPRLQFMLSPTADVIVAAFMLLFSVVIAIPGPFTNFIPSIGMFVIGLGILTYDGLAIIIGIIIGLIWTFLLVFLSKELLQFINSLL